MQDDERDLAARADVRCCSSRVAIVSGASGGIGGAAAQRLAGDGLEVQRAEQEDFVTRLGFAQLLTVS